MTDDVRNHRYSAQNYECHQSSDTTLEGDPLIYNNQSQLLKHHHVHKGLSIRGN